MQDPEKLPDQDQFLLVFLSILLDLQKKVLYSTVCLESRKTFKRLKNLTPCLKATTGASEGQNKELKGSHSFDISPQHDELSIFHRPFGGGRRGGDVFLTR